MREPSLILRFIAHFFAENDSKQIIKERQGKMYGKASEFI